MSYPNTPNKFTNYQNTHEPNNACFYGMANATNGLCQIAQINGIGLVTKGLVWSGPEIWFYPQEAQGLATGWTAWAGEYAHITSQVLYVATSLTSGTFTINFNGLTLPFGWNQSDGSSVQTAFQGFTATSSVLSNGALYGLGKFLSIYFYGYSYPAPTITISNNSTGQAIGVTTGALSITLTTTWSQSPALGMTEYEESF